ncbi:hypothetical protein BKA59DRAFT_553522 [Fusarium tricinctum]|uniref:Transcription factor domain-containing protein n=1 Tax=Fusarium tricinctum TaxID=61284 RepID=A0A8K0S0L7_9HYPO|nr:hypothetical protein BKA59DRAFT_553522 [Fusarium tricinctum]
MSEQMLPQAQRRSYGVAYPASNICDRCRRLQRHCVFEAHRRGLWRRDVTGKREEQTHRVDKNIAGLSPVGQLKGSNHSAESSSEQSSTFQTPAIQSRPSESISASSRSGNSPFSPASFVTNYQDTRGLSLGTALNSITPLQGELNSHAGSFPQSHQQTIITPRTLDPVDMGLISRPSSQNLYEGFLKHFNCLVGLLDPNLYTFSYTRSRSNLLFTMILAISSRIFQPESHRRIRDHAEFLLGRVLLACDPAVENIWAIICLHHWKDANDMRGYTLIGFALRMAASADWNSTPRSASCHAEGLDESTELQVRQRRDVHRVWLALRNIDTTSSYITDRPLLVTTIQDHVVSRDWMSLTDWTYLLGDSKAIGGHELAMIVSKVFNSMIKTRVGSTVLSHSVADFNSFRNDMSDFNIQIASWGEYWRSVFSTYSFQTPLTYLSRDYMRLYFNSVFLHRMLISESRLSLADEITRTTSICYSSARSVLQQAIEIGEMDIIYYLWEIAHRMIAYASMMIPKLIMQDVDGIIIPRNEALSILTRVALVYDIAAKSMGNPESSVYNNSMNSVSVQAHLLLAIVSRLKNDIAQFENDRTAPDMHEDPSISSMIWIEDQLNRSMLFSGARMHPEQDEYVSLDVQAVEQSREIEEPIPETCEGFNLMLDNGFINSRFFDAGLVAWDEPGIFIQPH